MNNALDPAIPPCHVVARLGRLGSSQHPLADRATSAPPRCGRDFPARRLPPFGTRRAFSIAHKKPGFEPGEAEVGRVRQFFDNDGLR